MPASILFPSPRVSLHLGYALCSSLDAPGLTTITWTEQTKLRESTHLSVLKVIASMPNNLGLDSLTVSDLAAIQSLLRTELNASAFSILHQHASYKSAHERLAEVNRIRLSKIVLASSSVPPPMSTSQPENSTAGPSNANQGGDASAPGDAAGSSDASGAGPMEAIQ